MGYSGQPGQTIDHVCFATTRALVSATRRPASESWTTPPTSSEHQSLHLVRSLAYPRGRRLLPAARRHSHLAPRRRGSIVPPRSCAHRVYDLATIASPPWHLFPPCARKFTSSTTTFPPGTSTPPLPPLPRLLCLRRRRTPVEWYRQPPSSPGMGGGGASGSSVDNNPLRPPLRPLFTPAPQPPSFDTAYAYGRPTASTMHSHPFASAALPLPVVEAMEVVTTVDAEPGGHKGDVCRYCVPVHCRGVGCVDGGGRGRSDRVGYMGGVERASRIVEGWRKRIVLCSSGSASHHPCGLSRVRVNEIRETFVSCTALVLRELGSPNLRQREHLVALGVEPDCAGW
jgi:hypothetical protein